MAGTASLPDPTANQSSRRSCIAEQSGLCVVVTWAPTRSRGDRKTLGANQDRIPDDRRRACDRARCPLTPFRSNGWGKGAFESVSILLALSVIPGRFETTKR